MSLIVSVSGVRGTIGGVSGDNLTPPDIVKFSSAYSQWIKNQYPQPTVVIGRDARISGHLVSKLVSSCLQSMGVHVIDLDLSTTPTVEMAVVHLNAHGGIILTASHNPKQWNALKLLNQKGEFLSAADGEQLLNIIQQDQISYAPVDSLGQLRHYENAIQDHVTAILKLPFLPIQAIKSRSFHIVADCINSSGAIALPILFEALGCTYELINEIPDGNFNHNPEPLPEHLQDLLSACSNSSAIGIAVDPDVDRLALVDEKGQYFGEEYTLVTVADYMLDLKAGNTVSNLSSSRALRDLTLMKGGQYFASAVGEAHVVQKMKEVHAIIGGEGNGGVILPDLHYGRDSLVGIALVLANCVTKNKTLSELKSGYPKYAMIKDKVQLKQDTLYNEVLQLLKSNYKNEELNTIDGLKIDFDQAWIHLRKSNTEPIIRIYCEAKSISEAEKLTNQLKHHIHHLIQ